MKVRLASRLELLHPGRHLEALQAGAEWRAQAGLQRRWVRLWRYDPRYDILSLPRGQWPLPAEFGPFGRPADLRLRLPPVTFPLRRDAPQLTEVQARAVSAVCLAGGGLLEAPGGSGKTLCGLYVLRAWRQPALVVVDSAGLVDQWVREARRLLALPSSAIGTAVDGRCEWGSHLTVGTRQTLMGLRASEVRERFGSVWWDEVDLAGCLTGRRLIESLPARFRAGGTATVERADRLHPAVLAIFGPVRATITEAEAEAAGTFMPPVMQFQWSGLHYAWPGDWPTLQANRALDAVRNDMIGRRVAEQMGAGHSVLVLCQLIGQAEMIAAILNRHGYGARYVTGGTERDIRERRLQAARDRRLTCLVATQVLRRGTDLPVVDRVHMADAYKSWPTVIQQVYRSTRPAAGKLEAVVHDWCDRGPQFDKQQWHRRRLYEERKWRMRGRLPERPPRRRSQPGGV